MKRRRALQALLIALGVGAQDAGLITSSPEAIGSPKPVFFTTAEMAKLRELASKIFPSIDGKPGASEAGVAEFLDYLISRSPAADQKLYRQGLAAVDSVAGLEQRWTYLEPKDLGSRFLRRLKDDVLRSTFNSREWIAASGRRGGGMNYYWKALD